jgi:hypothetical protein
MILALLGTMQKKAPPAKAGPRVKKQSFVQGLRLDPRRNLNALVALVHYQAMNVFRQYLK